MNRPHRSDLSLLFLLALLLEQTHHFSIQLLRPLSLVLQRDIQLDQESQHHSSQFSALPVLTHIHLRIST